MGRSEFPRFPRVLPSSVAMVEADNGKECELEPDSVGEKLAEGDSIVFGNAVCEVNSWSTDSERLGHTMGIYSIVS